MKKSFILSMIFILMAGFASAQTLLAAWTFDDVAVAPNTPLSIPSNYGNQSGSAYLYADGTNGSSLLTSTTTSPEWTSFNGYTLNDPRTTADRSKAVAIANSSANGKSIVFKLSTTGYANLVITFATRGTTTGFSSHAWSYSTDGSTFTNIPDNNTAHHNSDEADPVLATVDLSFISAINDKPTVYIKLTVDGATNASGNNRFDNFQFNATAAGPDEYAPRLLGNEVTNSTTIKLTFNEALNQSVAETISNYELTGTSNVTAATLSDERFVNLTTSPALTEGESYSLTIKNIKDLAGNIMDNETITISFGVSSEYHVATIAGLKAVAPPYMGNDSTGTTVYKYTGNAIITYIAPYSTSNHRQIYIQDATGGIMLYENGANYTQHISVGDEVSNVYGKLSNYYGLFEMKPTSTIYSSSFGNNVTPQIVPITNMDGDYNNILQCQLIKLQQVSFNTTGNFEAKKYYDLVSGGITYDSLVSTGTISDFNPDYIGTAIPTHVVDLIGVVNYTRGLNRIIIRDKTGITGINEINMGAFKLSPNPASDFVSIETASSVKMEIYSISGQLISSGIYEAGTHIIPVSAMAPGMYLVKFTNRENGSAYSSKLIVR